MSFLYIKINNKFQMIMDRLYKGVWEKVNMGGSFSRALFEWAYDYKKKRIENGYTTPLLDK